MNTKPTRWLIVMVLGAAVIVALGGYHVVRAHLTDVSCTAAGLDARPRVEQFIRQIPGATNLSWHDGCREGAVAALRFDYGAEQGEFSTAMATAGCTAVMGKQHTFECRDGEVRIEVFLHGSDGGTRRGLAVVTGT